MLNGTVVPPGSWPECTRDGENFIPFSVPSAANLTITVNDFNGLLFDVFVDGTEYPGTVPGENLISSIDVAGGVSTVGILVPSQVPSDVPPPDSVTVSVDVNSFISAVPEPATLSLLGFGAVCLAALRRRRPPA